MVQVPRLARLDPQSELPAGDRLNVQVKDQASNILQRTGAVTSIVEQGADIYQAYENDKIDTLSNEAEQEYSLWNKQKLQELRTHQGDPTDAYAQYEVDEKEKYDEILAKRPDLNERVRRNVTSNLDKVQSTHRVGVLKQRGLQQETYENNLFESTVKLKKNDLPSAVGYIRKEDPGSFLPFDQNVAEIKTLISKRAVKSGTGTVLPDDAKSWDHIYTNEEGKIVKLSLTDIAKQRVAKELSEGVVSSVDVLIAGGYTDEARLVQEKYKNYIDPLGKVKLTKKLNTNDVKTKASSFMQGIQTRSSDEQMKSILSIKDVALKGEVLKIKDTNDNRIESIRNRKHKTNYNTLASHAINKMNSDNPYYGVGDLENDPIYKQTWDNLDAKGKKAVLELVDSPKESASGSQAKIQNLFFGNDESAQLETITPEEFNVYLSGLNKADRKKYSSLYTNMRTETASEQRATYKRAESLLSDQLFKDKHLTKNVFGKFTKRSERRLIESRNELIDHLDSQYGTLNEKQLKDFVVEFSAAKVKDEIFTPAPRRVFSEKRGVKKNAFESLSKDQQKDIRIKYRKAFKAWPKADSPQFLNFIKENL